MYWWVDKMYNALNLLTFTDLHDLHGFLPFFWFCVPSPLSFPHDFHIYDLNVHVHVDPWQILMGNACTIYVSNEIKKNFWHNGLHETGTKGGIPHQIFSWTGETNEILIIFNFAPNPFKIFQSRSNIKHNIGIKTNSVYLIHLWPRKQLTL